MKHVFSIAVAFAAAALFSSCSNEADVELNDGNLATIQFCISSDDKIEVYSTRAQQTADNAAWYAQVGTEMQGKVSDLVGKSYTPGDYSIKVSNYPDLSAAFEANGGAGAAYYEAVQQVTLAKGTNTVSIACGRAKNAKVSVNWDGANGVQGLEMKDIVATQQADNRSCTFATSGTEAFFNADSDIECRINYTYNGSEKTVTKTIASPAAATEYKLVVTANSNGTIVTIGITYDDSFDDGGTTSTEIDAATGEEVI